MKVYWEDDFDRTREVKRLCRICFRDGETLETVDPMIVSSHGVAHESEGYGQTDCGRDATGPNWWWRT